MKKLEELVNTEESAWNIVSQWIAKAANKVEILPREAKRAEEALVNLLLTTRSLMGAVIYETGGLFVDYGWIRILGGGCEKMDRSLTEWNKGKTFGQYGEPAPYLLVADDVLGGLFAINGGFFGQDAGEIYYFDPQSLSWFPMELNYTEFLLFCFDGQLDEFYEGLRWKGWEQDLAKLNPCHGYHFVPFLWTKQNNNIEDATRKVMPMDELYNFNLEMKENS